VDVPVLVVHPPAEDAAAAGGTPAPIRRIMVPIDESPLSRLVVAPAEELARLLGAELILLSVVEPLIGIMDPALPFPANVHPSMEQDRQDQAAADLEEIERGVRLRGVPARSIVVTALGVAASILELCDREEVGLIAMSTHGAGGLRRAFLGSVTDKIIRGAQVPVLAWRPPQG
jgi:nucleotide-binding universal stress UspA family protein